MKKAVYILIPVAILALASSLYAVCAQNADSIRLSVNGKEVTSPEFVLVSRNPNGSYRVASYCIEGTCFSRFFGGDVSNVFFVQVTDAGLLRKVQDAIAAAEKTVIAGNSGLESDKYKGTRNLYTSDALVASSPLNAELAAKIDGLKKYPFLKINSVKNRFSFDNCGYRRVLSYDLGTGRLRADDNSRKPAPGD
jgi:hypothetical protein